MSTNKQERLSFNPCTQTTMDTSDEIVISGIAGRFPESNNMKELQDNLFNKIDMVTDNACRWEHDIPGIPRRIGKMNNINRFDASFFGINSNQVNVMDPVSRILLEQAYEAVMDAGVNPCQLRGSKTGVFIGACFSETENICLLDKKWSTGGYGITGCSKAMYANRISFCLGLTGPSYTIDSACSSSIFAIENAYRAIRDGQCDGALVGAANLCLHPHMALQFASLGVLSPDGRSKTFDIDANGYARGESATIIYLQKLKNAKRNYGTVVHCKINCDGFKEQGITLPSSLMHANLLRELYNECKVSPKQLGYMEAHGTGTKLGDPQEVDAIDQGLCYERIEPLIVGSIKTNLGHSEAACAMNSIAKIIIINETGKIPPNLNFKKPQKGMKAIEKGRIRIITETEPWNGGYAGMSALGFGGTNGHVLVKSHDKEKINGGLPNDNLPRLVMVSGRTKDAVNYLLDDIENRPIDVEFIKLLHDIYAYTIPGHPWRGYTIVKEISLAKNNEIEVDEKFCRKIKIHSEKKRPIWFVFSGMGSQWPKMGKDFLRFPVFAEAIRKCDAVLKPKNIDIYNILMDSNESTFDNILNSFVGIGAMQIGLVDLLTSLEIIPDMIIGHSMGEVGCAYADGAITAEQMILAIYSRGLATIETSTIQGSMAAIGLGHQDLEKLCLTDIDLACHNGLKSTTVSGPANSIKSLVSKLKEQKIFAKEINCGNVAFHSRYVADVAPKLLQYLKNIIPKPKARSSKWPSTSIPQCNWSDPIAQLASAEYFTNNFLNSVLFNETCALIPHDAITIEISPHGILKTILQTSLDSNVKNIAVAKRGCGNNVDIFLESIGKLYCAGIQPNIANLYPSVSLPVSRGTPMISPLIKWDHSDEWFVISYDNKEKMIHSRERTIEVSLENNDYKYMAGYVIDGKNCLSITSYLIFVWETLAMMKNISFSKMNIVFEDVKFLKPIFLMKNQIVKVTIFIDNENGIFRVIEKAETVATGRVYSTEKIKESSIIPTNEIDDDSFTTEDIYKEFQLRGYNFDGLYECINNASLKSSCGTINWVNNWDTFLAGMMQMKIFSLKTRQLFIPAAIRKLTIDTKMHFDQIETTSSKDIKEFKVSCNDNTDVIVSGGIQIQGLKLNSIARCNVKAEAVLESYKFVAHYEENDNEISLQDAIRLAVHLTLENYQGNNCKILEIVQSNDNYQNLLSPVIHKIVKNIPMIDTELVTIAEKNPYKDRDISLPITVFEHNKFSTDETNFHLLAGRNLLFSTQVAINSPNIEQLISTIKDGSFLFTIEETAHLPSREKFQEHLEINCLKIVVEKVIENYSTVFLLRKCINLPKNYAIIQVNNNTFSWVEELQSLLQNKSNNEDSKNSRIILISEKNFESGLIGLVKCLQKEPGGEIVRGFLLQNTNAPDFDTNNSLYKKQLDLDLSLNVLRINFTDSSNPKAIWGTYRYYPLPASPVLTKQYHAHLKQKIRGDLNSFEWLEGPIKFDSTVYSNLVKVIFVSINRQDMMLAKSTALALERNTNGSKLDDEIILGCEYSGIDCNNERVMGLVQSKAMSNLLESHKLLTWKIPDHWSLQEAATVPFAYSVSYLALYLYGKIKANDKILIHQGSDNIGQAAITLALNEGCEIFTTVQSSDMIKFIIKKFPKIQENHVINFAEKNFQEIILEITKGKGVDIVFNSLCNENTIKASLECLKNDGKFLNIAEKMNLINISEDSRLSQTVRFLNISLDTLFDDNNEGFEKAELKILLQNGINDGIVEPLNSTLFTRDQLKLAFDHFMDDKVTEKVLLQIQNENSKFNDELSVLAIPHFYCHPECSYVILGGLGGFGLELADWLINRGAKYLILVSRNGVKNGYQRMRINYWITSGIKIKIISGKMAHIEEDCVDILNIASEIAPVNGIFNLAAVLDRKLFSEHTVDSFPRSFDAKPLSTQNIDKFSRKICKNLQYFVAFSSISPDYSEPGLTNYTITNSMMERICEKRANDGLPALAIKWGAIGEVGLVSNIAKNNRELTFCGSLRQHISSCLDVFDKFLTQSRPIVSSMVIPDRQNNNKPTKALNIIDTVMKIMGLKNWNMIRKNVPLVQHGMDSILAVEIKKILEDEFNINLTTRDIWNLNFSELEKIQSLSNNIKKINSE